MEADPTRTYEILVGLGDVDMLGVTEPDTDGSPLFAEVSSRYSAPGL